jgi:uncharacterized repeat protein (TIGR03803 family)
MYSNILPAAAAFALIGACTAPAWAAPTETILHSFTAGTDGGFPHAGLIADSAGVVYGTTDSGGTAGAGVVFKLVPPAAGQTAWTETVLYNFTGGADGGGSFANLMMDKTGALYGTTISGGTGAGVVFKLTPPAKGQTAWTESVLYAFTGYNDGNDPWSVLIEDSQGTLYGSTTLGGANGFGVIFKLTPPAKGAAAWTETVLYNFTGGNDGGVPFGGLVQLADGALYGTTGGLGAHHNGVVFKLVPPANPKGRWKYHVLHSFKGGLDGGFPETGLIADSTGALYGTTGGGSTSLGTVFKLTPPVAPDSNWQEMVLHRFHGVGFDGNGPWATVAQDASGALYGTTLAAGASQLGEVYKLTPPAAGDTRWTQTVLHAFHQGVGGQFPYSNIVVAPGGMLYGTTYGSVNQSTGKPYPGTVWSITQ